MIRKILFTFFFVFTTLANAQQLQDCSECSTRLINVNNDELSGLSKSQLRILKNEIYARKGHTFSSKDMKDYFSNYSWYRPLNNNAKIKLNDIETQNVALIDKYISTIDEDPGIAATNLFFEETIDSKHKWLSDNETARIFTDAKRKELGIKYPVWKAYSYTDKSGEYLLALAGDWYEMDQYKKIQAVNLKKRELGLTKTFEMNDLIDQSDWYSNIFFWTRYTLVEDFDRDGVIEPIIIYGADRSGNFNDCWVKILIYHNNVKTRIWIHNSSLDHDRYMEVDEKFYSLPKPIQTKVIMQMEEMQENGHCYLGHTWKEKMQQGVTKISD